jgi:hypothetical protein
MFGRPVWHCRCRLCPILALASPGGAAGVQQVTSSVDAQGKRGTRGLIGRHEASWKSSGTKMSAKRAADRKMVCLEELDMGTRILTPAGSISRTRVFEVKIGTLDSIHPCFTWVS